MRYTVTTFKVRLEVCDIGDRTGGSDDVMRVARSIFAELDADKGADVMDALRANHLLPLRIFFPCYATALATSPRSR
jgi:hypothetical protein